ncbi:MAG: hypothetical protein MJ126_05855 [Lachnospiraceae bacterium]|nr:hypothetical protein [Lachnospiraceae bacterium]
MKLDEFILFLPSDYEVIIKDDELDRPNVYVGSPELAPLKSFKSKVIRYVYFSEFRNIVEIYLQSTHPSDIIVNAREETRLEGDRKLGNQMHRIIRPTNKSGYSRQYPEDNSRLQGD